MAESSEPLKPDVEPSKTMMPTSSGSGRSLVDRMSEPIEEASIGVSALLSSMIRKSLRTGLEKIDEGLESAVAEKIDIDLRTRGPELEEVAKNAAREETSDQIDQLRESARNTATLVRKRLDALEEKIQAETDRRESSFVNTQQTHDELSTELQRVWEECQSQFNAIQTALKQQRQVDDELRQELQRQHAQMEKWAGQIKNWQEQAKGEWQALKDHVHRPGFFTRLWRKLTGKKS